MTQAERIYMISDAARQVEVEAHVLRYWEEELEIPTRRNEMGHRYYTEEDIRRFRRVKELKEQGLQLKAIRHMLKNGDLSSPVLLFEKKEENEKGGQDMSETAQTQGEMDMAGRHVVMMKKGELLTVEGKTMPVQQETREQKSLRLQQLLREMIMEAVASNNEEICQEIKMDIQKELDYQFRLQEEREDVREEERVKMQEEHYQQLDELLRSLNQKGKKGRKMRRENVKKENIRKGSAWKENQQEKEDNGTGTAGQEEPGTDRKEIRSKEKGIGKGFLRKKRSIV